MTSEEYNRVSYCRKLAVTLAGLWRAACEDGIAPRSTEAAMERLQAEVSALASDCVDAGLITERKAQELHALAWGYVECGNCGQQLFVSPEEHIAIRESGVVTTVCECCHAVIQINADGEGD